MDTSNPQSISLLRLLRLLLCGTSTMEPELASWFFHVVGNPTDLADVQRLLGDAPWPVQLREGKCGILVEASQHEEHSQLRGRVEEYLALMNGVCAVKQGGFRPVTLADRASILDENGKVTHVFVSLTGAEARLRAVAGNVGVNTANASVPASPSTSHSDADQAVSLLAGATGSPQRGDVTRLIGKQQLSWPELYTIFELVQSQCGGQMHLQGWISKRDGENFCRTANSYEVLRDSARHGKSMGQPPSDPMTFDVANRLIRKLAADWLLSGASSPGRDGL